MYGPGCKPQIEQYFEEVITSFALLHQKEEYQEVVSNAPIAEETENVAPNLLTMLKQDLLNFPQKQAKLRYAINLDKNLKGLVLKHNDERERGKERVTWM